MNANEHDKIVAEMKEILRREILREMDSAIIDCYFPQNQITDWQKAITLNRNSVIVKTKGL